MSWNHRILAHENNGEVYFQNSTEGGMSSGFAVGSFYS